MGEDEMKHKKAVYLAGKMQGLTIEEMTGWRIHAARKLKEAGFEIYDPTMTKLADVQVGRAITGSNKYHMKNSDIVLMEFDFPEVSIGTVGEAVYSCEKLNIPVIAWGRAFHIVNHPWVCDHLTAHFEKLDDAVEHIAANYS